MSQEILFRTSALGFNKQDVIEFIALQKQKEAILLEEIEKLKLAKNDLKNDPKYNLESDISHDLLIANSRIADLEIEKDKLEQELLGLSESLEYIERALKEKDETIESLENLTKELKAKADDKQDIEEALKEKDKKIEELEELTKELKAKVEGAQEAEESPPPVRADENINESQSLKSLESQLGSAIIDARRYSERIIQDAKSKSSKISAEIYLSVNETTTKVESLAQNMDLFKADFESTLRELGIKLESLYKNLHGVSSDLAQRIEAENIDFICTEAD